MRNNNMIKKELYFLFFLLFLSCSQAKTQKQHSEPEKTEPPAPITLVFGGDVMQHMPQVNAARITATDSFDYTPCFQFVKPVIEGADLAVCNLEAPLAGKPYSGYPQFSAPDGILYGLKDCGFDVFQLGNNHILDRGSRGLERTIEQIQENDLYFIGAYTNQEQRDKHYPLIIPIKGVKIAFINFTYDTNGLIVKEPNRVNYLDSAEIIKDIEYAKQQEADLLIALPHWGTEYLLQSDKEQQRWAELLINNGVDAIIGSHPHVVQEAEIREFHEKKIPVFYSLGNLISNQRKKNRYGGIFVKVEISPESKQISSVCYLPFYVHKGKLNEKHQYYVIPTQTYSDSLSNIRLPSAASRELKEFHEETTKRLRDMTICQ